MCGVSTMPLFTAAERRLAEALGRLVHTNPFSADWVRGEREVLGAEYTPAPEVYDLGATPPDGALHPNLHRVGVRVDRLVEAARRRLESGGAGPRDLALYQ